MTCDPPMNPSFSSHMVNEVFGDPGLLVEVRWSKRALLSDHGHNNAICPTRLLRAADVFISYAHMDHFIGSMPCCASHLDEAKPCAYMGLLA